MPIDIGSAGEDALTGVSLGLLRAVVFSSEKYRKSRLSYGMAQICSLGPNGLVGEKIKGNKPHEISSGFM
jgi:hypothetical protein